MVIDKTLGAVHTLGNLKNKKEKHKGMMYLCNFKIFKII